MIHKLKFSQTGSYYSLPFFIVKYNRICPSSLLILILACLKLSSKISHVIKNAHEATQRNYASKATVLGKIL